ncbi:MAG: DUF1845 family protein [Betaproteobacteria bacterium]|nr:DUF1845 family protein [Betaproteobacteria bacterium]
MLQSRVPQRVELGFASYGYAVADLVVRFDTCNRVLKTLVRKDLLPDRDGRTLIYSYTRRLRGLFERAGAFRALADARRTAATLPPRLPPCSRAGQQARAGGLGAVRSCRATCSPGPRAMAQPAAGRAPRRSSGCCRTPTTVGPPGRRRRRDHPAMPAQQPLPQRRPCARRVAQRVYG